MTQSNGHKIGTFANSFFRLYSGTKKLEKRLLPIVESKNCKIHSIKDNTAQNVSAFSLDMFDVLSSLGCGNFAQVFLVIHKLTKRKYALKKMQKCRIIAFKQVAHVLSEKNILQSVSHPNIVNLHCTFNDSDNVYLLMEHVSGGDMFTHLREKIRFSERLAKFYFGCLVLALEHLHGHQIIHRDLKPENVLLDESGYIKIADFGLAKRVPSRKYTTCGTPDFMAPEVIKGEEYGFGVDWWSAGVLLFEFLAGYGMFSGSDRHETFSNILDKKVEFPAYVASFPKSLILALTDRNPETRLGVNGVDEIKTHPWFDDFDWDALAACTLPVPASL
mmetsp:Transcript_23547/g.32457  ORF Transcript_23547/g.32457 Transcript_23547/m.32457 type:complete len:332 (-) Transcript_23547:236-1231(-)|eukprot:CAMPEP_0196579844 /NCGR_PEP_ID=MMETSP1081-20130531/25141_1 /TAXON_ID=36882 /ORGANISM="Pyramimonas amylifera, Strain CCMP720" /LENGTH=331 /DNA_ID=CAMNT_0041899545 /DNA_START=111 /DNA_END=1106 /DNA_ORIENTATION=+